MLAILVMAIPASAQQCLSMLEDKRFTLVVPYSPGGGYDGYARVFAAQFEALTGSVMRIRFLPGAGAMIGINAVAQADPSDLVLGLFNPTILLNNKIVGSDSPETSSLVLLGSLNTDTTAWIKKEDKQVLFDSSEPRLFAVPGNSDFTRVLLPGYALGWNINLIRGYTGSGEGLFAVLREDVDFFFSSSISMANQIQSLGGLTTFMTLTAGPDPIFPEAAYLAGAGGVVEQLTRELNVEQQRERQEIARLSVELAKSYRAISISSSVDSRLVDCLLAVVETTIFSNELQSVAAEQNLTLEPIDGTALKEEVDRAEALIESNWDLLQQLVARYQ